MPPAVIRPQQPLPGSSYGSGGALRNKGVGHPEGEPGSLGIRRCNRDLHHGEYLYASESVYVSIYTTEKETEK